ncbi:MAG TPA: sugar phosphate isomerase/epimerase family protein [Anaerolineales bacterium]
MKLSCLPVSFFAEIISGKMTLGDWARMGVELGLDAIDLSILFVPDRSPQTVTRLRDRIESAGIGIAMVTSYPDFTHPDACQRAKELELEIDVVETAHRLGAKMVRVTAGQAHPGLGKDDGICWAVEGLSGLAERVRGSGVQLVYENHAKPGAWQYADFSQPPDIFLEIARQTASAPLGINFDTGNAAAFAADPLLLLQAVIGRVISLHASDSSTHGALNHCLLGTGITPFAQLFSYLKQQGWDGWICMEEASNLGRNGVEKAAAFVRSTWSASGARRSFPAHQVGF